MRLFRIVLPLLLAGALPCVGQTVPPKQSVPPKPRQSVLPKQSPPSKNNLQVLMLKGRTPPCVLAIAPGFPTPTLTEQKKLCAGAKRGAVACYSIRDYQFEIPKNSEAPMLKSYSTCVPAARFEAKNVVMGHSFKRSSAGTK